MSGLLQAVRRMSFAGATGAPATCDFVAYENAASPISLGDAAPDRRIFSFLIASRTGSLTLLSASIGGVPATIHGQRTSNYFTGAWLNMALVSALVPSGATAAVASSYTSSSSTLASITFRATGLQSDVARSIYTYDTDGDDDWSTNMDVAAGGFSIAAYVGYGHPNRVLDTPQMTKVLALGESNTKSMAWSNLEDTTNASKSYSWATSSAPSLNNTGPFIAGSFR